MLNISFYDGVRYGRQDFMNRDIDFFGNGVINPAASQFAATFPATPNMTVNIGQGVAWVDGYRVSNDSSTVTVTVTTADVTYNRIDIIQIGHDDVNKQAILQVKKGVASSSPVEPGADSGFVKLYAINVNVGVTAISSVTDKRSLVPLNVSATQIALGGAAGTSQANVFTQNQTAPEWIATGTTPFQVQNLASLPALAAAGALCVVNSQWYQMNAAATAWVAMIAPSPTKANALDVLITSTSIQQIASYTPLANGNFLVYVSVRVVTGATTIAVEVDYNDVSGAQVNNLYPSASVAVGTHMLNFPLYINAVAGTPIVIKLTASAANQVYASASIVGV